MFLNIIFFKKYLENGGFFINLSNVVQSHCQTHAKCSSTYNRCIIK